MKYVWFVKSGKWFIPVLSGAIIICLLMAAIIVQGSIEICKEPAIIPFLLVRVLVYAGCCIRCFNYIAFKLS